ncbi:MAG: type II secretion system F family protein [Actinomycetota bacterium]
MEVALAQALAVAASLLAVAAAATRAGASVAARLEVPPADANQSRLHSLVRRLGGSGPVRRLPGAETLSRRLALAGWSVPVEEVVGWKVLLALSIGFVVALAPPPARVLAPVLAIAGFRFPDLAAGAGARRRLRRADRELPLLIDLLAAASCAGLSGQIALRRAIEATEGPLSEELSAITRSVDLGARWRNELRAAADRLGLPDLRRAAATLTRSESLGSSLSDSLSELATQVRDARRAAASERARTAPVKMLFPLVFLVLPAFLLLTVVPVLVTTLRSIS